MPSTIMRLEDVHKRYRIYRRRYQSVKEILIHRRLGEWEDHWALKGINLEVQEGTTLGLLGPNGAGKSTTLKLMARILTPDKGRVSSTRRVAGLLELGAGFQLEYTGIENIYLNASLLGLTRAEIKKRLESIIDFSELGEAINDPIRTYSTGMVMRLAFSVAIHVDPEVLLVDEVLSVGDVSFQKKCMDHIVRFQADGGTIVLVTHGMGTVREMCNQAVWIDDGVVQEIGNPTAVINAYVEKMESQAQVSHAEGTPAAELTGARMLNRAGMPVHALRRGDPLNLEVSYRVNRPVEHPAFGVAVSRNDGAYVYGTNTWVEGTRLHPLTRDGSFTIRFESLPVLGGTYRFGIALFREPEGDESRNLRRVHALDGYYSFQVEGATEEEGVVRLEHSWNLDPTLTTLDQERPAV